MARKDQNQIPLEIYLYQKLGPDQNNKKTQSVNRTGYIHKKPGQLTYSKPEIALVNPIEKSSINSGNIVTNANGKDFPDQNNHVCPQLILITAFDSVFSEAIYYKCHKVLVNYTKKSAIQLIGNNSKFHGGQNCGNLEKIEDQKFWAATLPKMLKLICNEGKHIAGKVQMLPSNIDKTIVISRLQVLILLSQMFLCILPKQAKCDRTSFSYWISIPSNQPVQKSKVKRQKLKCLINYFNMIFERNNLDTEFIEFQRSVHHEMSYLSTANDRKVRLQEVHISSQKMRIEEYYKRGIMVDFANKNLGGGILGYGAVQQQILFSIFPQAIISKIICQELEDSEAVIIHGAERFSNYDGYAETFSYLGSYKQPPKIGQNSTSIMVAIDAIDFSKLYQNSQYRMKNVKRQINKAFTGFNAVDRTIYRNEPICTGRWGCGVYGGQETLKFLIQWIACSEAKRQMVYLTNDKQNEMELQILYSELKSKSTTDLLCILEEYDNLTNDPDNKAQIQLIDYIKDFV